MRILEGFICDEIEHNLFERVIVDMTEKRNIILKDNKNSLQASTKKCSNSVYGGCIRKDIEEIYKCVT